MKNLKQQMIIKVLLLTFSSLFILTSLKAQLPPAQEISAKMKVGCNLGNTLEAICSEDAWGAGKTSQRVIDSIKAAGFNTIRIPSAWFCHSDTLTNTIDADWIARVKEVIDYCMKDSLYTVLNIHWDQGWLDYHINVNDSARVNARQRAYWTQIAEYFKDYGEYLLFAGANEPPAKDTTAMSILLTYHQTFIDAVRATGGNNSTRTLVIQGPSTDIDLTNQLMNTLPTDVIENRLMVEVHYYTPYQFCLMEEDASWGKVFYYWGKNFHSPTDVTRNSNWGEEADVEKYFEMMKTKFVDKGIPVIIGEYGAYKRNLNPSSDLKLHDASVEFYHKTIIKTAVDKGIIPYLWDTPGGLFDRNMGAVRDSNVLNAIMVGAGIREPEYYSLDTTILGSGTLKLSPEGSNFEEGTAITLKAKASAPWIFESWGGDLDGTTNPTTLVMRGNQSIIANFTLNPVKIMEQMANQNIAAYPNPFTSSFTIRSLNQLEIKNIEIFDLAGNNVETFKNTGGASYSPSMGALLQQGIYVVVINCNHSTEILKVFKEM